MKSVQEIRDEIKKLNTDITERVSKLEEQNRRGQYTRAEITQQGITIVRQKVKMLKWVVGDKW